MIRGKHFWRGFFLLALLAAILLAGCQKEPEQTEAPTEGDITLWIVTEESPSSGMNAQIRSTARVFQEKHEGVKINLEILPKKKADRELRLEQLRTQIMAGGGPDGFLLPPVPVRRTCSHVFAESAGAGALCFFRRRDGHAERSVCRRERLL